MPFPFRSNVRPEWVPRYGFLRLGLLLGFVALFLVYLNVPNGLTPESFRRDCTSAIRHNLPHVAPSEFMIEGEPRKRPLIREYTMNFRVRNTTTSAELARGRCIVARSSRAGDHVIVSHWETTRTP